MEGACPVTGGEEPETMTLKLGAERNHVKPHRVRCGNEPCDYHTWQRTMNSGDNVVTLLRTGKIKKCQYPFRMSATTRYFSCLSPVVLIPARLVFILVFRYTGKIWR